ncbi:methyl-accepting chemotaxis protein [Gynuella sp.]|uniref:methyl-accepting chemotaxis protein n=1 Tax=Gynuella sp. TaxID=2969146 RepID=UPI003D0FCFAD
MLDRISIRQKLITMSVFPVIGIALIVFVAMGQLEEASRGVDRIYRDRIVPLEQLKVIADDYAVSVIDSINKANSGSISGGNALVAIQLARKEITQVWQQYLATSLTQEEVRLVKQAENLFVIANRSLDEVENALRSTGMRGDVTAKLGAYDGPLYRSIDPISNIINQLIDLQISVAQTEKDAINESYFASRSIFILIALVTLFVVSAVGVITYLSIKSPLDKLGHSINTITENSDLSVELRLEGKNELVTIANSFETMLGKIRSLVKNINQSAQTLSSSAVALNNISEHSKTNVLQQRDEIQQVTTAMTEMLSTAREIAANAENANRETSETSQQVELGNEAVRSATRATQELVEEIHRVTEQILAVDKFSDNIGSVITVIQGIAEQTNLLALNAAIEAARAGNQGRGFAVVADEVRDLAQKTQDSTSEVKDAIEKLQNGTRMAASAMETNNQRAAKTGESAVFAGTTLDGISRAINLLSDMNTQIATASEEQSQVCHEIERSIMSINNSAVESSNGAEKIAVASEELANISEDLLAQIRKFKT